MKYGKMLREEAAKMFPEWRGKFISYKELKQQLKLISRLGMLHNSSPEFVSTGTFGADNVTESNGFARLLDSELDKAIAFYFEKEEEYIIRLKELKIRAENLKNYAEKLEVQKDTLDFRAEMLLLLQYSVLNYTGLVKIVKKHNKRTGTFFQFSSMPRVMQQPSFSTDLLYELARESEAMLSRLNLSDDP